MSELVDKINHAEHIWIAGNGGSAATAEHLATDLVKLGVWAIALSANTSVMTMIGNDYGYDQVFSRQLEVYGTDKDLLVTISCSGTSPNIVEAQRVADEIGMDRYEFEVFSDDRDYRRLEDRHLQFAHSLLDELDNI